MNFCLRYLVFATALGAITQSDSVAAELYRYKNEDNVTVLNSHIPARYVKNGYTILSLDGRVLEVVPRALTEQEIRDRDRRIAEEARVAREERERKIADENLMRLYGSPSDVIRARDAKLASIDSLIQTQQGNIQRLEAQKRQIEAALADIERSGGVVGRDRLARIRALENRISQIEDEIGKKDEEKAALEISYAKDLKRVRELYSNKR
ncbi:MAG: hypothetical protein JJ934_03735 [Pseudomonadales bacterium]|nr:hypothetical protein [Pseudomonadales bacterium]MBO6563661.1 hypothetical protein [Pseudomonadales bacterium]MBO6655976.1 hypothetical protein [Pseudomonadales bacterium]MBO6823336.1 hypothetical protein [Pseudomonadales bacterium]MBO7004453.1 hypothetical protein [Pseudomonadales bacterium]